MPIPKRIRWISGYIEIPETHWQVQAPATFNSAYMCFAGQNVWVGVPALKLEFQTEVDEGALSGYFLNPITSLASVTINQTTYTATATINPGVEVRGDGTNSLGSKGGLSLTLNMRSSETYYGSRNIFLYHLYRAMYSSVTYRYIWDDCPLYSFSQLAGTIDVDTSRTYTKNDTDAIFQNVENVHSIAPYVQNIVSNSTSINNILAVAITSVEQDYCTLVEQDALEFNYDYTYPTKSATSSYQNSEIAVEWIGYIDNMCLGTGMPIRKLNNFGDRITFDSFSNYGTMTPPNVSPGYKMASHYDLGGTFRYTQTIWRNYSDPYTRDQWNCLPSDDYTNVSLTRNGTPTQSGYTFPDTTTASWHYESEDPTNIALVEFGTVLYNDRAGTVAASYDFATGTIHYSGMVSDIYPVKNNLTGKMVLNLVPFDTPASISSATYRDINYAYSSSTQNTAFVLTDAVSEIADISTLSRTTTYRQNVYPYSDGTTETSIELQITTVQTDDENEAIDQVTRIINVGTTSVGGNALVMPDLENGGEYPITLNISNSIGEWQIPAKVVYNKGMP